MVGISYSIMDIMIENVLKSFRSKSTGRLHYVHSNILVHSSLIQEVLVPVSRVYSAARLCTLKLFKTCADSNPVVCICWCT
jgi:hypothetical protein